MPNRKKRAQRRQGGMSALLPALIAVVAAFAAVLAVLLVRSNPLAPEPADERLPYQYTQPIEFSADATPEPLVLGATVAPTGEPAVLATPEAQPEVEPAVEPETEDGDEAEAKPTEDPQQFAQRLAPTPAPGDYFLPVYSRALRTPDDRAMIAVTVDDCDKPEVMRQLAEIALRYGAKLTLFPTGTALMQNPDDFRNYYQRCGFELENRTYDAGKMDYALTSGELALQLWRQGIATSYVLGRDYQQHFYRPKTPQSAVDQRTHFFLRKTGLLGVATYTHTYLAHDVDYLSRSLANGNIYQFDVTEESLALFEGFLAEANRKGYKMVTMNELFGLTENALGPELTIDRQTLPGMDDYVPTRYNLKLNDRACVVFDIQDRLMDLGYLIQPPGYRMADGIYGSSTSTAVSEFQARVGIAATGNADVETQEKLFADDAPVKQ